jgi:hypothetical protein
MVYKNDQEYNMPNTSDVVAQGFFLTKSYAHYWVNVQCIRSEKFILPPTSNNVLIIGSSLHQNIDQEYNMPHTNDLAAPMILLTKCYAHCWVFVQCSRSDRIILPPIYVHIFHHWLVKKVNCPHTCFQMPQLMLFNQVHWAMISPYSTPKVG